MALEYFDCCCTTMIIIIVLIVLWRVIMTQIFAPPTQPSQQYQPYETPPPIGPQVVYEKETIREIIMIRCQYCGTRYDEHLTNCPKCGGK